MRLFWVSMLDFRGVNGKTMGKLGGEDILRYIMRYESSTTLPYTNFPNGGGFLNIVYIYFSPQNAKNNPV